MTLREMLREWPEIFYPQTWYLDEAFLDITLHPHRPVRPPTRVQTWSPASRPVYLPHAVDLALAWKSNPLSACWSRYLWCIDRDQYGQQVYVGTNGRGLEIHRHLALTSRWGVAQWT